MTLRCNKCGDRIKNSRTLKPGHTCGLRIMVRPAQVKSVRCGSGWRVLWQSEKTKICTGTLLANA